MLFPFLDDTTFHAQCKATSGDSNTPLEEAYAVIEEQNVQIQSLDDLVEESRAEKASLEEQIEERDAQIQSLSNLVEELQAEKASLEERLANYQCPHTRFRGTSFNPTPTVSSNRIVSQTPRPGTLQHYHNAPSVTISSPHFASVSREQSLVSPTPTCHSVPTQPLSSSSTPIQPTHYQAVTPLCSIGGETESVFDNLRIPDRFHRNVCEIAEHTLPTKWRASLLELGFIDASNVQYLVEAMQVDVSQASRR